MEVRTGTLSFLRARDIGPRTEQMTFNFSNPVRQAVAGLAGKNFGFSPRDDHHLALPFNERVDRIGSLCRTSEGVRIDTPVISFHPSHAPNLER